MKQFDATVAFTANWEVFEPAACALPARASITPAVIGTMEFRNMVHPRCG
jgi:hypothetical protein